MLNDRFWTKVDKDGPNGCWVWLASKNNKGYGMYRPGGLLPKRLAHRLSFEDAHGFLGSYQVVMHTCDNPACVNPIHLEAGTRKQNMEDAARKERGGNTRLTAETVVALRKDYISGLSRAGIAEKYSISLSSVSDYTDGRSWSHVLGVVGAPTLQDLQNAKRRKPSARLSVDDVRTIKARLAAGETCRLIGADYGLGKQAIHDIKSGRNWKDVP